MKTKRKVATFAATLITFGSLAGGANADILYAYYDGTIESSDLPEADIGDSFSFVVALDNGGNSLNSQTWEGTDVQSITFYANDGAINVEFSADRGEITGPFTSDADGNVTGVGEIVDLSLINYTNIGESAYSLYINGRNGVFITPGKTIRQVNPSNNQIASSWTLSATNPVPTDAVPEPSSAFLLGFGVLGVALHRRRRSEP